MSNTVQAGAAYEAVLVDKVTDRVDNIVAAIKKLEDAFNGVKPSAQAVAQAMSTVGTSIDVAAKRARSFGSTLKRVQGSIQGFAGAVTNMGQAVGQSMLHVGQMMRTAGVGTLAAAGGIAAALYSTTDAAAEYTEAVSRLKAISGDAGDSNLEWAEAFAKKMGRGRSETIKSLASFRGLFASIKSLPSEKLDEMAKAMQQASVDFSSGANVPDDMGATKMLQAMGNQADELKRFGFTMMEENVKDYAASLGIASSELDTQTKLLLRYQMLMQQMEDLNFAGDLARTMGTLANQTKLMTARFANLRLVIGKQLEPTAVKLAKTFATIADSLADIAETGVSKIVGAFVVLSAAGAGLLLVGSALTIIAPLFMAAVSGFAALLGGLAAFVGFVGTVGLVVAYAVVSIGLLGAAAATLIGYFMLREFPMTMALKGLGGAFGRIGKDVKKAIAAIQGAIAVNDWTTVWNVVKLTGEIAFRELGIEITKILTMSIIKAGAAMRREFYALELFSSGGMAKALSAGLSNIFNREPESAIDALRAARERLDSLYDLLKFPDDPAGGGDGGGYRGGSNSGQDNRIQLYESAASVGDFSAQFAKNVDLFAPSIDPVKRTNQKLDQQLVVMGNQLKEQTETNRILAVTSEGFTFA